jgi:hypothetical protein
MGTNLPFHAPRLTLRRVPLVSSRAASLRSLPSCRYRPSSRSDLPGCPGLRSTSRTSSLAYVAPGFGLRRGPEGRLSSEEGSGVRTSRQPRSPGFPEARGDRGHRGRRPRSPESWGYLPHRPKPLRNPHRPKPLRALAGGSARHRPKPVVRRSRKRAPRALPPERGACRSGHRAAGTLPERGACRSGHRDGGVRGLAGLPKQARRLRPGSRCLPKQVRWTRAGVRCLPKQASGDPRDDGLGQPKLSGSSGPVGWACRSRLRGTGHCRRGRGEPPFDIPGRGGLRSHRSGRGAGGPCPGSR